jgi:hypothetical protein
MENKNFTIQININDENSSIEIMVFSALTGEIISNHFSIENVTNNTKKDIHNIGNTIIRSGKWLQRNIKKMVE